MHITYFYHLNGEDFLLSVYSVYVIEYEGKIMTV